MIEGNRGLDHVPSWGVLRDLAFQGGLDQLRRWGVLRDLTRVHLDQRRYQGGLDYVP